MKSGLPPVVACLHCLHPAINALGQLGEFGAPQPADQSRLIKVQPLDRRRHRLRRQTLGAGERLEGLAEVPMRMQVLMSGQGGQDGFD